MEELGFSELEGVVQRQGKNIRFLEKPRRSTVKR
jgi:hypothetical protein